MKTPAIALSALVLATTFTGCVVSPDYSHYDWHARGGTVAEEDRNLAAARIEPFQSGRTVRRAQADEPLTPPGAPPARTQTVVVDPR
jgi:hypothetical protein